jgi:hypothetical protein
MDGRWLVAPAVAWLALLGPWSCSDDSGSSRICEPGATQRCVCPAGDGAQTCDADGTRWGTCECTGADADADVPGEADTAADADADTGEDVIADGDATPTCGAGAVTATVQQITEGTVGPGTVVRLEGVVAMSQQFLVSRNSTTNSCLWGVFVSAPGLATTAANTGLLVTSYGVLATVPDGGTSAYCPVRSVDPTGSAIPDDVQPGDVLDVIGEADYFLLDNCATEPGGTTVPQRQLSQVCSVVVTGTVAVPAPAVVPPADVARLAAQTDTAFHDQWGGVKVRLTGVGADVPASPTTCTMGGNSVVGNYGIITLASSSIPVSPKLYYVGYLRSEPCHAYPEFCTAGASYSWTAIDGFHYLDFCTWGLAPNDKCAEFDPRSADCTSSSCAPY